MLGKLVEIHPRDAWYGDREALIGSIWELDGVTVWTVEDSADETVIGYSHGKIYYRDDAPTAEFTEFMAGDNSMFFFAVKFEPIETLEND